MEVPLGSSGLILGGDKDDAAVGWMIVRGGDEIDTLEARGCYGKQLLNEL